MSSERQGWCNSSTLPHGLLPLAREGRWPIVIASRARSPGAIPGPCIGSRSPNWSGQRPRKGSRFSVTCPRGPNGNRYRYGVDAGSSPARDPLPSRPGTISRDDRGGGNGRRAGPRKGISVSRQLARSTGPMRDRYLENRCPHGRVGSSPTLDQFPQFPPFQDRRGAATGRHPMPSICPRGPTGIGYQVRVLPRRSASRRLRVIWLDTRKGGRFRHRRPSRKPCPPSF